MKKKNQCLHLPKHISSSLGRCEQGIKSHYLFVVKVFCWPTAHKITLTRNKSKDVFSVLAVLIAKPGLRLVFYFRFLLSALAKQFSVQTNTLGDLLRVMLQISLMYLNTSRCTEHLPLPFHIIRPLACYEFLPHPHCFMLDHTCNFILIPYLIFYPHFIPYTSLTW